MGCGGEGGPSLVELREDVRVVVGDVVAEMGMIVGDLKAEVRKKRSIGG